MNSATRDWGRFTGQAGLYARRYKNASQEFWQTEMNLAYLCWIESTRQGGIPHPNHLFLVSQTLKQLLGLDLVTENSTNLIIGTPHDNGAREALEKFIQSKSPQFFMDLIKVYGESINAFSSNPDTVIWDNEVFEKFVMTLEYKKQIVMTMMLQISLDKTRSNHQYIVRALSPTLRHVFAPNLYDSPPEQLSLQMHRMAALSTRETFPTVKTIEIKDPFPKMVQLFQKAGISPPYTPEKFINCESCGNKPVRRLASSSSQIMFCEKDECVQMYLQNLHI